MKNQSSFTIENFSDLIESECSAEELEATTLFVQVSCGFKEKQRKAILHLGLQQVGLGIFGCISFYIIIHSYLQVRLSMIKRFYRRLEINVKDYTV